MFELSIARFFLYVAGWIDLIVSKLVVSLEDWCFKAEKKMEKRKYGID